MFTPTPLLYWDKWYLVSEWKWNPSLIPACACSRRSLHCHTILSLLPSPSSPVLPPLSLLPHLFFTLASVVGDPLFDPLFSGGSESGHDRRADGGEPLISTEDVPLGSSQNSMCVCVCASVHVRTHAGMSISAHQPLYLSPVHSVSSFFADAWPWDHIFRPNVRGRTELACEWHEHTVGHVIVM